MFGVWNEYQFTFFLKWSIICQVYGKPTSFRTLKALFSSRQAFIKIESSNKLRHPLRKRTRKTQEFFDIRQEVYCKRNSDKKWKEPGKVIKQDQPLVFIRHGGCYVKNHFTRVQVANKNNEKKTNPKHVSSQPNQLIETFKYQIWIRT